MGWSFYAAAADRKSLEQVLPGFHNKTSPMAFRKGPPVKTAFRWVKHAFVWRDSPGKIRIAVAKYHDIWVA